MRTSASRSSPLPRRGRGLEGGRIGNAPTIIALQWLLLNRESLRQTVVGRLVCAVINRSHPPAMDIRDGFTATVGNTPLIKLRKASEITGCTILGKAEFLNPGGSVKDRAALAIIQDAEASG